MLDVPPFGSHKVMIFLLQKSVKTSEHYCQMTQQPSALEKRQVVELFWLKSGCITKRNDSLENYSGKLA